MLRATAYAATLCCVVSSTHATELAIPPKPQAVITCDAVRAIVTERGMYGAYEWAKQRGYSDQQINEAMKCLR